jgi:hypothetical protein
MVYGRTLPEDKYLFLIDDLMINDEFGGTKVHLVIVGGAYGGRRITARVFRGTPDEEYFKRALGLNGGINPEAVKARFVRALIRKKPRRSGGGVLLIVVGWEAADPPPDFEAIQLKLRRAA